MDFSLDKSSGRYVIRSYSAGTIIINNASYEDPIILGLEELHENRLPTDLNELNKELLDELKVADYEVVILGTGESQQFPSWDLLEQAQMIGTPLEVMATDAACRTFAVLASEGRKVLALLYP